MLTLINGEKLIVREEIGDVVERILAYRARLAGCCGAALQHIGDLERAAALVEPGFGQPARQPRSPADSDD